MLLCPVSAVFLVTFYLFIFVMLFLFNSFFIFCLFVVSYFSISPSCLCAPCVFSALVPPCRVCFNDFLGSCWTSCCVRGPVWWVQGLRESGALRFLLFFMNDLPEPKPSLIVTFPSFLFLMFTMRLKPRRKWESRASAVNLSLLRVMFGHRRK